MKNLLFIIGLIIYTGFTHVEASKCQFTSFYINNEFGYYAAESNAVPYKWRDTLYMRLNFNKLIITRMPKGILHANDTGLVFSDLVAWADLSGKPTTLSGYGITDAYPLSGNPSGFLTSVPAQSWASITGKPTFATVATSGDYNDLINKPTIPAGQVNSDWNSVSGLSQILNKPTIPTISGATGFYGLATVSNGLVTGGKKKELFSGTSNASGVYTVTFANTYSVAPNVQASITINPLQINS